MHVVPAFLVSQIILSNKRLETFVEVNGVKVHSLQRLHTLVLHRLSEWEREGGREGGRRGEGGEVSEGGREREGGRGRGGRRGREGGRGGGRGGEREMGRERKRIDTKWSRQSSN